MKKRIITFLLAAIMLMSAFTLSATADYAATEGEDYAYQAGTTLKLAAAPIIYQDRTLAQLWYVVESLGKVVSIHRSETAPLELTAFIHKGAWGALNPKWVIFGRDGGAASMTNVDLKGTANNNSTDSAQEFSLMMANFPLPDIIHGSKTQLNQAATMDEALIPLNDLITDEYAPNIKKFFEENPEAWSGSIADDGNLYYIPNSFEGTPSTGFFIRKDWLDKLGLAVPTTVDEYYEVLKAFREQDPNGNGLKDEIPYFDRNASIDGLTQLFGAHDYWYVSDDGIVGYGKATEEHKNAMKNLAKWYAEGLIDPEIYMRGQRSRDILLGDNLGGATHDWFSSTSAFNILSSHIDGFEIVAIVPPADIYGNVKTNFSRQMLSGEGWGISVDNRYAIETIKYFDFWFSEQGQRLYSYGIEGVDYNMVDGEPVFTDVVLNAPDGAPTYLRNRGQCEIGARMSLEAELAVMNPIGREGFMMYEENGYSMPSIPRMSYTANEEKTIRSNGDVIFNYTRQMEMDWLFGTVDIDATWDEYLRNLDDMGYQEMLNAQQSAYDRYLKDLGKAKQPFGN